MREGLKLIIEEDPEIFNAQHRLSHVPRCVLCRSRPVVQLYLLQEVVYFPVEPNLVSFKFFKIITTTSEVYLVENLVCIKNLKVSEHEQEILPPAILFLSFF